MSIALSVSAKPRQTILLASIASMLVAALAMVAMVAMVALVPSVALLGAVCIVGIALLKLHLRALASVDQTLWLNISAQGQLSLSRQDDGVEATVAVDMQADSTFWPWFILLRLRQPNKKIIILLFFPYSLSPDVFRKLSVACRWIAARSSAASHIA